MDREADILRKLKRRLTGARGTVMLEFAFVAPLVAAVALFAFDFTRILRTEQQLEIANRLAADVEAHMVDYSKGGKTPSSVAKKAGKFYLVSVAHVARGTDYVYMKGDCSVIKNPISVAVAAVAKFFDGGYGGDGSAFVKDLGKILGGLMDFFTFRTQRYLTEVIPHDMQIKVTTAAYIPTLLPSKAYEWLGIAEPESFGIGVGQFAPDLETQKALATAWQFDLNPKKRHRVYCYMPVIDTVPVAPKTYVRMFKSWASDKFLLKWL